MSREGLIQTALGKRSPELLLKNGRIVNVFTGEICPGNILIADSRIAAVLDLMECPGGCEIVDLQGRYVAPGFIDAHCHVESSMASPPVYCAEAARWGTTTLITDPHEIANVAGADGVRFMLSSTAGLPVNYYVQLPSCVPATPFEHSGAVLDAESMRPFLEEPRVLGLGELMDYPSLFGCAPTVLNKLALFDGRVIDGHAPGMTGRSLQACAAAGTCTDHESTTWEEAREKLRAGLAVLIREGSACKNLEPIINGLLREGLDTRSCAFCTDDKHLSDIRREGTIRWSVRCAIGLGMPPVTAIQLATINAARIYRLHDLGAVAPGYRADLVILDDLTQLPVHAVYKDGKRVRADAFPSRIPTNEQIRHSVHIAPLTTDSLRLPPMARYPVIQIQPGNVTTAASSIAAEVLPEKLASGELLKICVAERHHATGCIGVGLLEGYGLRHGAVGTTVAHDSHNMILAGDNDGDLLLAAYTLEQMDGGYVLARDGTVLAALPLPLGGLMSCAPADELIPALSNLISLAHELGVPEGVEPFLTLSFLALPVIPEIRITDLGVFDVAAFRFLSGPGAADGKDV